MAVQLAELTPVAVVMVVVQRPQPMVVVADILVVGNTDHSLLFVHIAKRM